MKYTYRTWVNRDGTAYAMIAQLHPHRYGKSTAYGERMRLKPGRWIELGRFPDRKSAVASAKQAIDARLATF